MAGELLSHAATIALEVLTAFFLEASFLGIMLEEPTSRKKKSILISSLVMPIPSTICLRETPAPQD
jgi:cytochrome bd-type quinol oxidase subunit 1